MNSGFDAAGVPSTGLKRAQGATDFILHYAHDSRSDDPSENVSYADRPDAWVFVQCNSTGSKEGSQGIRVDVGSHHGLTQTRKLSAEVICSGEASGAKDVTSVD